MRFYGARRFPAKAKDDVKNISLDWAKHLGSDTISAASWSSYPTGLSFGSQTDTTTKSTVAVSGGTKGVDYLISCQITKTTSGEKVTARAPMKILNDGERE